MAQQFVELCSLLVEQAHGTLSSRIFTTVAAHGGITLHRLRQLTRLTPVQLKHSLSTLLQQHLLFHVAQEDGLTRYQVDWRHAYFLARSGRIVSLVRERYGDGAGQIVCNLVQLGHAKVGDLEGTYDFDIGSPRDSGIDISEVHTNGDSVNNVCHQVDSATKAGKITTSAHFHNAVRKLLRAGFLSKVGKRTYVPDADLQEELEASVVDTYPNRKMPNSAKRKKEFEHLVNGLKRKQREEDEYSETRDVALKRTSQRVDDHAVSGSNKRVKLSGDEANHRVDHIDLEEEDMGPRLPLDLVVRVNFDKCVLALRTQRLGHLAKLYMGDSCGAVYGALLRTLEGKVRAVRDDLKTYDDPDDEEAAQPTSSVQEIAAALSPEADLALSIRGTTDPRMAETLNDGSGRSKRKAYVVEDPDDFSDIGITKRIKREQSEDEEGTSSAQVQIHGYTSYRDKNRRFKAIEEHLAILEEHPLMFCKRAASTGRSEWRVNFPQLAVTVANAEFDNTVTARLGRIGARVVRMLREKGKLDEKQIAQSAMMRIRDIRAVLTNLQRHGFLRCQELPKDATRQPSRTLYLWYFDSTMVRSMILYETYKAMARCFVRIKVERQSNYKDVVDKAERLDVKGNENSMLSTAEKQLLKTWREVEERLLTQIDRCDDVVAAMRDFDGKDTSMST